MGKRIMVPVEQVDIAGVKYQSEKIDAPHLTGFILKLFVWIVESRFVGRAILSALKRQNNMTQHLIMGPCLLEQLLQNTVIPEAPMFVPQFPPQDLETAVNRVDEGTLPILSVASALECLPSYNASCHWGSNSYDSFLYWTIRDYAHAYRTGRITPSNVAERIILAVEDSNRIDPPMKLFISFDPDEVRKQAAASTRRFEEGNPLSILDGIFIPIKDDIDCYPHPTRGGTVWLHKVREVKQDAVCVKRLRSCGVILVGKANMHELGMGTTGNNPHHG
eukprot:Gb_15521 [translate_table: standard]